MTTAGAPPYHPAWWLPGAHLQTLWPYLFQRRVRINLCEERLELPDGDFVDLVKTADSDGPLVLIFHGLEGSINSPYARPMMRALQQRGWQSVFMHFRGCSGTSNRLDRRYHSGDTGDIATLVETMKTRYPGRLLAAIGYSLGGNALLKYLGETGRTDGIRAAVAVSVPYLLDVGAKRLDRGLSRLYQRHLLRSLRRNMLSKYRQRPAPVNLANIHRLKNFYDFDDQITAPLHGFTGADDYYRRCSSRQFLKSINIPVLLLHARNDPFMTDEVIPDTGELSGNVSLELSPAGGHAGFVSGKVPWHPVYWLEHRIPRFFQDCLA